MSNEIQEVNSYSDMAEHAQARFDDEHNVSWGSVFLWGFLALAGLATLIGLVAFLVWVVATDPVLCQEWLQKTGEVAWGCDWGN